MGNKITPFNLSAAERASSCKLGQKVGVELPRQQGSLVLGDIAAPHSEGADQYLDFSEVRGMTFRVPACPCGGSSPLVFETKVNSPEDFKQLKDDLNQSVWMENRVCWRAQNPATTGALAPGSPQLIMSPDSVFKTIKSKVMMSLLIKGAANLGAMGTTAALSVYLHVQSRDLRFRTGASDHSAMVGVGDADNSSNKARRLQACTELWVEEECAGVKLPEN